jgi:hypothetical protein
VASRYMDNAEYKNPDYEIVEIKESDNGWLYYADGIIPICINAELTIILY